MRLLAPAAAGGQVVARQMVASMIGSEGAGTHGFALFPSYSHFTAYRTDAQFVHSLPLFAKLEVGGSSGGGTGAGAVYGKDGRDATADTLRCNRSPPDIQEAAILVAAWERLPAFWERLGKRPLPPRPWASPMGYEELTERQVFDPAGLAPGLFVDGAGMAKKGAWAVELAWPASSTPLRDESLPAALKIQNDAPGVCKVPPIWPSALPNTASCFDHVEYHRTRLAAETASFAGTGSLVPRQMALAFSLLECYEADSHREALDVSLEALRLVSAGWSEDEAHAEATVGLVLELGLVIGANRVVLNVLALHEQDFSSRFSAGRATNAMGNRLLPLPAQSEMIFWNAALVWYRAKGPRSRRARKALATAVECSPFTYEYLVGLEVLPPRQDREPFMAAYEVGMKSYSSKMTAGKDSMYFVSSCYGFYACTCGSLTVFSLLLYCLRASIF